MQLSDVLAYASVTCTIFLWIASAALFAKDQMEGFEPELLTALRVVCLTGVGAAWWATGIAGSACFASGSEGGKGQEGLGIAAYGSLLCFGVAVTVTWLGVHVYRRLKEVQWSDSSNRTVDYQRGWLVRGWERLTNWLRHPFGGGGQTPPADPSSAA